MAEKEKVIVFIDGSNHYHIIKDLFSKGRPKNFDFEKFVKDLVGDRMLVRAYYYSAPFDRKKDEETYMKQQRFFDSLRRIPNFSLVLCRMQKAKVNGKAVYQVKEDDIHLAVDMVKLAYNKAYDVAILVSSDGDFVPAIKAVKEIGIKVENVGFENKFSYHLRHECDKFTMLKEKDVMKYF